MAALLKAGAAVGAVDAQGRTPLETAQAGGHIKVADFIAQWAPPKQAAGGDAGGDASRAACGVAGYNFSCIGNGSCSACPQMAWCRSVTVFHAC